MNIWTELHQWCREEYRNTKQLVTVAERTIHEASIAIETERKRLEDAKLNAESGEVNTPHAFAK